MSVVYLDKTLKLKESVLKYPDFIHVIIGPRQVGKTTAAKQICKELDLKSKLVSADGLGLKPAEWFKLQWSEALAEGIKLLVVDEIQKVEGWSEAVKECWDQRDEPVQLVLLGSSSLEIHKGLSESLAGRVLRHVFYHWDFEETLKLEKMTLDDFLIFGGYPGSYVFKRSPLEWLDYIKNSIIDPVINKDILSLVHVKSPALFRQCFDLICSYSAQEVSYTKLLGQLQDKGNTDLVKHYIDLFEAAFLIKALQKYSAREVLKKRSSPKFLPLCPALYSVTKDAQFSNEEKGHAFEVVVGAYLNKLPGRLYYWRERNFEVDFVYEFGKKLYALEVKYGKNKSAKGLEKFVERYPQAHGLVLTPDNFQDILKKIGGEH